MKKKIFFFSSPYIPRPRQPSLIFLGNTHKQSLNLLCSLLNTQIQSLSIACWGFCGLRPFFHLTKLPVSSLRHVCTSTCALLVLGLNSRSLVNSLRSRIIGVDFFAFNQVIFSAYSCSSIFFVFDKFPRWVLCSNNSQQFGC